VFDFPNKCLFSLKYYFKTADATAAKVCYVAPEVLACLLSSSISFQMENRHLNFVTEKACFA
jgi:hypothetical protein